MIILIEGFDCTGKTTLSNNLLKILKFDYLKAKGPYNTEEALKFVADNLRKYSYKSKTQGVYSNLIWERCPIISHLAYSPIIDKKEVENKILQKFKHYQSIFKELETVVVFCKASPEVVKKRLEQDKESLRYLKMEDIGPMLKKYEEIIWSDYMKLPIIESDTTFLKEEDIVCQVVRDILKKWNEEYN